MKNNKFITIVFLSILFLVLVSYPVTLLLISTGRKSIIMTDNWQFFTPIKENNIVNKIENIFNSKKTSIENRVTNYFPLFLEINSLYEKTNFITNSFLYKNDIPIKKNSDNDLLFYNKENKFFYLTTSYSEEELNKRLNNQVDFFNKLNNQGIDIYIYIPTRYELTTLKESNLNNYISKFEKQINNNIHVSHMNIKNIDEYKEKFYLTDHHWTITGALDAYYSITNMLNVDSINNLKVKKYNDVKFYGTMAKTAMLKNEFDYLEDVDINLSYDVYINGKEKSDLFKPRTIKKVSNNDFYDYYVSYFNGQYGEILYDYKDESKENLLIISDSYAWEIDYLIASSFNKTYVINLRYDEYINNNLELAKYIKEKQIDKVLFLYEGGSILFDQNNYNLKDRVI